MQFCHKIFSIVFLKFIECILTNIVMFLVKVMHSIEPQNIFECIFKIYRMYINKISHASNQHITFNLVIKYFRMYIFFNLLKY